MNGVKKLIRKPHIQFAAVAIAIPLDLILRGNVSDTITKQPPAQVVANEKMKNIVNTIIQLPAP